jgi:hypothetical protein
VRQVLTAVKLHSDVAAGQGRQPLGATCLRAPCRGSHEDDARFDGSGIEEPSQVSGVAREYVVSVGLTD